MQRRPEVKAVLDINVPKLELLYLWPESMQRLPVISKSGTHAFISDISRNWDQAELRSEDKNPESPTPLGCYIEGYPTPTYSWTSNLTDITSTQTSMLSFSSNSRKIGSAEEITCIGTVGKGGE